jgi:hypothetical protein
MRLTIPPQRTSRQRFVFMVRARGARSLAGTVSRMKRRWKLLGVGCALLFAGFCVVWLSSPGSDYGGQDAFHLVLGKKIQQGATNILIFRLTSLDDKKTYLLPDSGQISVPLSSNQATPVSLVGNGDPAPVYGRWTWYPLPPAQSVTNFAPTALKAQTEFAILAPTNAIWRMNVKPCRVLSRVGVFRYKIQKALTCLKTADFSGFSRAWSGPWSMTFNYLVWSDAHTNGPTGL